MRGDGRGSLLGSHGPSAWHSGEAGAGGFLCPQGQPAETQDAGTGKERGRWCFWVLLRGLSGPGNSVVGGIPSPDACVSPRTPAPWSVTFLKTRNSQKQSVHMRSLGWALTQQGWCPSTTAVKITGLVQGKQEPELRGRQQGRPVLSGFLGNARGLEKPSRRGGDNLNPCGPRCSERGLQGRPGAAGQRSRGDVDGQASQCAGTRVTLLELLVLELGQHRPTCILPPALCRTWWQVPRRGCGQMPVLGPWPCVTAVLGDRETRTVGTRG